jgi:hypothetical protein
MVVAPSVEALALSDAVSGAPPSRGRRSTVLSVPFSSKQRRLGLAIGAVAAVAFGLWVWQLTSHSASDSAMIASSNAHPEPPLAPETQTELESEEVVSREGSSLHGGLLPPALASASPGSGSAAPGALENGPAGASSSLGSPGATGRALTPRRDQPKQKSPNPADAYEPEGI